MNLIFCDVDGVLNSRNKAKAVYEETHKSHSGIDYPFDEKCLENLKTLVRITNSKLVITSVWREDVEKKRKLLGTLKEYELDKKVIGYTPIIKGEKTRGIEIKQYLSTLKEKPNFIILDDDTADMRDLLFYIIKTDNQVGLTEENVKEAIMKFNRVIVKEKDEVER